MSSRCEKVPLMLLVSSRAGSWSIWSQFNSYSLTRVPKQWGFLRTHPQSRTLHQMTAAHIYPLSCQGSLKAKLALPLVDPLDCKHCQLKWNTNANLQMCRWQTNEYANLAYFQWQRTSLSRRESTRMSVRIRLLRTWARTWHYRCKINKALLVWLGQAPKLAWCHVTKNSRSTTGTILSQLKNTTFCETTCLQCQSTSPRTRLWKLWSQYNLWAAWASRKGCVKACGNLPKTTMWFTWPSIASHWLNSPICLKETSNGMRMSSWSLIAMRCQRKCSKTMVRATNRQCMAPSTIKACRQT